ncbi:phosphate ABC transporter substrate-binding protein PstS [Prochlorococcus sp. MIT 1223]|uniref:phosphate ABC transporter substrate-binding protein PstS n=1 Tax=Prochlorococcus sp. MIT 1223 TaxID=3096217 RepID=UPI002A75B2CC|nr:phosphate ABC transporter substrate-binding protein PstS [Prochlorococcus sp. MIT 1223]
MTCIKKAISFFSFFVVGLSANALAGMRISGAGATFPSKIYTRWFADLSKSRGIRVNYQAIGSGAGRKAFMDQTVNFGASDDPMKDEDIEKITRGLIQIPMIGGTIAFGYNHNCDLQLTQKQAVNLALGNIKNWSELNCPSGKILWVHRSDGSGTTKAFTSSMQSFSKDWFLGTGKSVKWPSGIGAKGNAGVAGAIRNTPGAIGYLNQSYIRGNIKAAAIKNLSGEFIKPTRESGAIALNEISLDKNLAGSNPNPKGKGAYPISTLTWVLAYETGNGKNSNVLKEVFSTLLSKEYQDKASDLGYIPLEGKILSKSLNAINRISK